MSARVTDGFARSEDIEVTRADTELTTHALGALASRVTHVAGRARLAAAASAA